MQNNKFKTRFNKKNIACAIAIFTFMLFAVNILGTTKVEAASQDEQVVTEDGQDSSEDSRIVADNVVIIDQANLLTSQEEQSLLEQLQQMDDSYNYLIVTEDNYVSSMQREMEGLYRENFGADSPGAAFVINMDIREIYSGASGSLKEKLSDDDALDVTNNTYKYASDGDYYKCISETYKDYDRLINDAPIRRTMRYVVAVLVGLILGFLIMYIVMVSSRRISLPRGTAPAQMKNSVNVNAILVGATIPTIMNVIVHKTRHQSSGGSSGGGSHGGGGGGGMSGGGHSF